MNQLTRFKPLAAAILIGWCLLFLRCETTEKSMVRAMFLSQNERGIEAVLWYQSPEASADASEASAALQMVCAEGATLEKALFAAQAELPQTADYRLCDYLLIPQNAPETLLSAYEQLILERQLGRTAARVVCVELDDTNFSDISKKTENFSDKLIEKLKQNAAQMPRLYQHPKKMILPVLTAAEDDVEFSGESVLRTPEDQFELSREETELSMLLEQKAGTRVLWLDGKPVHIRRCSVSVGLQGNTAYLRMDCQLASGEPQPSESQRAQLEQCSKQLVETFWQQGVDLLCLQQYDFLQNGAAKSTLTTKNACPQIQADVRFIQF